MSTVIAVMDASGVVGREVVEVLGSDAHQVWPFELRLFGKPDDTFVRFRDADIDIQVFDANAFQGVDIAIQGGERELAAGAVVVRIGAPSPEDPLVVPGLNTDDVEEHRGTVRVPDGAAEAVARIARALGPATRVSGTVLQPASVLGPLAIEELYEQVNALFAHQPLPDTVLGDRLAFNVLPGPAPVDVSAVAGCPVSLAALLVPIFGGTTLVLEVGLRAGMATEALARLRQAERIEVWDEVQPAQVVGDDVVRVQVTVDDESQTARVVAVADEIRLVATSLVGAARAVAERDAF